MKFLAILALIWICVLIAGAGLGAIGKLIWLGILLTVAVALWKYLTGRE